jgi:hypothetical protein
MRHRDIEFRLIQGIERGTWHWSAAIENVDKRGRIAPVKSQGTEPTCDKAVARSRQSTDIDRPEAEAEAAERIGREFKVVVTIGIANYLDGEGRGTATLARGLSVNTDLLATHPSAGLWLTPYPFHR